MQTKCKNCGKIIDGLLCVECFNKGYINHDYDNSKFGGDTGDIWISEEDKKKHDEWENTHKVAVNRA